MDEKDLSHQIQSVIKKLINSSSTRSQMVSESSNKSLFYLSQKYPQISIKSCLEILESNEFLPKQAFSILLNVFTNIITQKELENTDILFNSLQARLVSSKDNSLLDIWDNICSNYIDSELITQKISNFHLNSPYVLITLMYASKFISNKIATEIDSVKEIPISISPRYFIKFASELAQNITFPSQFLSKSFITILYYNVEHTSAENIEALINIYNSLYPHVCLLYAQKYINILTQTPMNSSTEILLSTIKLLCLLCNEQTNIKPVIDYIIHLMYIIIHEERKNDRNINRIFPIEATEIPPSCVNVVFTSMIAAMVTLCKVYSDLMLKFLFSGLDNTHSPVVFITLCQIMHSYQFSEEQLKKIIGVITLSTQKHSPSASLCQVCIDLLQLEFVSEENVKVMVSYILNSTMVMNNAHFFLQLAGIHENYIVIVFDYLCEYIFDDQKIPLLAPLSQTLNLLMVRRSKNHQFSVHESPDDEANVSLHPLVPILMKSSISEKSLYLLRILSSLMSLGALHPFVPAMLSNLSIFFDFSFPLAFEEIHNILENVTRCINSSSEFPSLIMSLLSNIMKLINDLQFRISLCTAIFHEIEAHSFTLHTQNCLSIFSTIVPFLTQELASADIKRLFACIPFDDISMSNAFAEVLGVISASDEQLVLPYIVKWRTMKSNAAFLVSQKNVPVSYQFICMTVTSVARNIQIKTLTDRLSTDFFPIIVGLMKRKEIHPFICFSALSEICQRISFRRSNLAIQSDFFFKYIINNINIKQRPYLHQLIQALRYLIQVPPCITVDQYVMIKEKLLIPQIINLCASDKPLFIELRGLLLAILCVMPHTKILCSILQQLLPLIDHHYVLSMVWRMMSLLDAANSDENGSVQFYQKVQLSEIPNLMKLVVEILSASYNESNSKQSVKTACALLKISKPETKVTEDLQEFIESLSADDIRSMTVSLIELMHNNKARSVNYSFVLGKIIQFDPKCLTANAHEKLCHDLLIEQVTGSTEFVEELLLINPEVFVKHILIAGVSNATYNIITSVFTRNECFENIIQQLCILLLEIPDDERGMQIISLIGQLVNSKISIPMIHLYQIVASIIIYGFAARFYEETSNLFVSELRNLASLKNFVSCKQTNARQKYFQVLSLTLNSKFGINEIPRDATQLFNVIFPCLMDKDQSLFLDVMNFLMSTCQINRAQVSSALAMFCGEVLLFMSEYSDKSALFNLYFSTLLSFGPLFDSLTCICCLNEIIKMIERKDIDISKFPPQYISRILQVLFKRSTSNDNDIINTVITTLLQFCCSFADVLTDKLHEFIFGILIEFMKLGAFSFRKTPIDIIECLIKNQLVSELEHFSIRYKTLYSLISFHPDTKINSKINQIEVEINESDTCVVLNMFFESNVPWMLASAISFISSKGISILPTFIDKMIQMIDHPNDDVASRAAAIMELSLNE